MGEQSLLMQDMQVECDCHVRSVCFIFWCDFLVLSGGAGLPDMYDPYVSWSLWDFLVRMFEWTNLTSHCSKRKWWPLSLGRSEMPI